MVGLVSRVDALEAALLAEGASPVPTAIQLRVQHLEDICLGETAEGALVARVRQLEEACFGQARGPVGAAPAATGLSFAGGTAINSAPISPIGQGASQRPPRPACQAGHNASAHEDGGPVFVGDLPADVEQEELQMAFAGFGDVADVHIMRGKSTSGRSCAFVLLDSWQAGERAINALSGACSLREGDPPIIVSWPRDPKHGPSSAKRFTSKASTRDGLPFAGNQGGSDTKLFVGNLPKEVQSEDLQGVFGTYGLVTSIHVMAGKSASGQSCAFVEYTTPKEAETAIYHLNEKYEALPGQGEITVKHARSGGGRRVAPY